MLCNCRVGFVIATVVDEFWVLGMVMNCRGYVDG